MSEAAQSLRSVLRYKNTYYIDAIIMYFIAYKTNVHNFHDIIH